MSTLKYTLRYIPLAILAFISISAALTFYNGATYPVSDQAPTTTYPSEVSPYLPGSALYDIAMSSTSEGWAVGGTFSREIDEKNAIERVSPTGGMILRYTNETGWIEYGQIDAPLFSVSFVHEHDGWAAGYGGILAHYDGETWNTVPGPPGINVNLNAIDMVSPNNGWAVGQGGTILHYDGTNWTRQQSPTQEHLYGIDMVSAQEGWATGESGTLLHYHSGQWEMIPVETDSALYDVMMLSADEGWAVGKSGTVLHYRLNVWSPVCVVDCSYDQSQNLNVYDLFGIAMASPRDGWIIHSQGLWSYEREVWSPTEAGESIWEAGNYNAMVLNSIIMVSPDEGWAVGYLHTTESEIALFHYTNGKWTSGLNR